MALIEWRHEFEVGIPDVDYEHREMVELINTLHAQMAAADPRTAVAEFLGEVYAKISAHFALEEKFMRARGYDRSQEHKDDHERLLDELRDLMDRHEEGTGLDEPKLARALHDWFVVHFKTHDARLHRRLT